MRTLLSLSLSLSLLTLLALSMGCPDNASPDDAGLTDAASSETVDASVPSDAGREDDGGEPEPDDAGGAPEDAGRSDAGQDAGAPDAGASCTMPPIEPPPPLDEEAGPPACALVDIEGAIGRFEGTWDGTVQGSFEISGPFELPARGEMSFEIYCGDNKLLVDGTLEGRAYQHPDAGPEEPGHPFSGRIFGEYDLETGAVVMVVSPATLTVGPFVGTFEVAMRGQRVDEAFEDGQWCGHTITPAGGTGEGSWRATRQ